MPGIESGQPLDRSKRVYIVAYGDSVWVFGDSTMAELSYTAVIGSNQYASRFDMSEDDWAYLAETLPPTISVKDYRTKPEDVTT